MSGYSFFHDCHHCSMALCKLQAQKTLNTQPRKNSKEDLHLVLKGWFTHSGYSMLLQPKFNSTKWKEKMLKPKEQKKQSSVSTQIHEMKCAFWKLEFASNFAAGKKFLLVHSNLNGKIWRTRKDSAQSPQTQWKIPGIKSRLAITFSVTSINK